MQDQANQEVSQPDEPSKQELEEMVSSRAEVKKLAFLSTYGLLIFYTIAAGFVCGMLLTSLSEKGVWAAIFGGEEPTELPDVESEGATFELIGLKEDYMQASLREAAPHANHGRALANQAFDSMGLAADQHSLFLLRLANLQEKEPLKLSSENFHVELVDSNDAKISSIQLPSEAKGDVQAMRLMQHSPTGEIPPSHLKDLWVVFEGNVDLAKISGGQVKVGDQTLDLEVRTLFESR